jgi:predicted CXXCH cytochrome family protein
MRKRTHAIGLLLVVTAGALTIGTIWIAGQSPAPSTATYVGSTACSGCHAPTFERWKRTRMANVVRDPREHPDAIVGDFTTPNPLVTFTKDQIAFVYGSKFKQRYFKRVENDFAPLPVTWDVTHRQWRAYGVAGATSALCDGCHSVNYDIERKTVTEWNVGCERCHGPGSDHVKRPVAANIVNPARLTPVASVDVCLQCHSEGHPHRPIGGREFHWPVGFRVGLHLADFWRLDEHTPGTQETLYFADGSARENRMQGNDFVQSLMHARGVTCASCHDPHGTPNNADLIKPARLVCLTCHGPKSPNGPHTATIELHTHHASGSTGSECVSCHMPKIAVMLGDVMVRSHTFRFIVPAEAERLKMPDACTTCHTDKRPAWATAALRTWPEFSPWRVGQ